MNRLDRETNALRAALRPSSRLTVTWYDVLESTNTFTLDQLERGIAQPPLAILAREQTAGRGRRGRMWLGDRDSLFLTWAPAARQELLPAPHYAMASGLAVYDVCRASDVAVRLKWPNDVLFEGAKLAGILVESRLMAGRVPALVIGLGVNVNQEPDELPRPADTRTSSLRVATGRTWDLPRLAAAFLDALSAGLARFEEEPEREAERYRDALGLGNGDVLVEARGRTHRGTLVRIDPSRGAVLLEEGGERVFALETLGSLRAAAP